MRSTVLLLAALSAVGCIAITPRPQVPGQEALVLEQVPVQRFGVERCGAGSLAAVMSFFGEPIAIEALDEELPKAANGGVLSLDLLLAARRRGFRAELLQGDGDLLRSELLARRPVILMLLVLNAPGAKGDLYHYVVVDGIDPGRDLVRVQLGDGEARWVRLESLQRSWKGAGFATLVVQPSERGPDDDSALRYAVALEEKGSLAEAAALYRNLLQVEAESALLWINLGNVEAARGLHRAAEQAYRRALALDPEASDALNNLAWLLYEAGGDPAEAERLVRRAVASPGPDPYLALDTLGWVLSARGRCEEAIAVFEEALRSATFAAESRAWILYGRGLSQRDCGLREQAKETLREALMTCRDEDLSIRITRVLSEVEDSGP